MSYSTLSNWGPGLTPSTIKKLIIFTCTISILSAAIQTLFDQFGLSPGPQDLLSLSWHGINHGFVWQFITYFFIQESMPYGLSFSYLVSLLFNMYVLWTIGTQLFEYVGKGPFLRFYFTCGILAGITALLCMPLINDYSRINGIGPVLLALLTAWCMIFADAEILLFFLIPIKAKWLVATILGAVVLVTLSHWDILDLILYLTAILSGYAYAVIAWGVGSPFPQMKPIDNWLIKTGLTFRPYIPHWKFWNQSKTSTKNKIVDIETGKAPENDDAFIDAMLAKISKYGESSLSWTEKKRMQQISERRSRNK